MLRPTPNMSAIAGAGLNSQARIAMTAISRNRVSASLFHRVTRVFPLNIRRHHLTLFQLGEQPYISVVAISRVKPAGAGAAAVAVSMKPQLPHSQVLVSTVR